MEPTKADVLNIFDEYDDVINEDYIGDMARIDFRWHDGKVYRFEWDTEYGIMDARDEPWELKH